MPPAAPAAAAISRGSTNHERPHDGIWRLPATSPFRGMGMSMLTSPDTTSGGIAYAGATFIPWKTRAIAPPRAPSATARPPLYRIAIARNVPSIIASPTFAVRPVSPPTRTPSTEVTRVVTAAWWNHPK